MNHKATRPAAGLVILSFLALSLPFTQTAAFGEERIPITVPVVEKYSMPQVFFSHDRHVEVLGEAGKDCSACHVENDEGMSERFLNVEKVAAGDQVAYMHASCTECHVLMKRGPRLVECRLCHSASSAASQPAAAK